MTTNLLAQTMALLAERKGQWPAICAATGLGYDWLTKLAQGRINDPGVRKIQRLHDHLSMVVRSAEHAAPAAREAA